MNNFFFPTATVSTETFDKVLTYPWPRKEVSALPLESFDRYILYFKQGDDGTPEMLCPASLFKEATGSYFKGTEGALWKSIILINKSEQRKGVLPSIDPPHARAIMLKILYESGYSKDDIVEIYSQHQLPSSTILHRLPTISYLSLPHPFIRIYKNCYSYDLNGAYASLFMQMFPKAHDRLLKMFLKRHENNDRYKCVFNYSVGMLTQNERKLENGGKAREIYPETRHWIVQHVTDMMMAGMSKVGGNVIYENTDGFITQNPTSLLETGKLPGT